MIAPLFKQSLKSNWLLIIIFVGVLLLYTSFGPIMYDPKTSQSMEEILSMFPQEMMDAFGWSNFGPDYVHHLASVLYGFVLTVFPVIYIIILSHSLVAKLIDRGSFIYYLATPHARKKIIRTQGLFLVLSLSAIYWLSIGSVLLLSACMFPGLLDIQGFFKLNVITYLVLLLVSGVSFFGSCLFSDAKKALSLDAGVPVLFLLLSMLREASDKLAWLKYLTPFTLIDFERILADNIYVWAVSIMLLATVCFLFWLASFIFNRRDLVL